MNELESIIRDLSEKYTISEVLEIIAFYANDWRKIK